MYKHLLLVTALAVVLLIIYLMVAWSSNNYCIDKNSAFECGFDPLSSMRAPFSTRFFVLVVLFLIFDIEVSLLFPILSMFTMSITITTMSIFFGFLLILILGLFYEWSQGAIDWMTF
uniref:NADH dehydrogenase subunit 3 n=1 Tax=Deroceras laeve TaxID=147581 RepID=UPI0024110AB4|nr:NADH dehydrogenase subunit 3 [Deroceras laeve]WEI33069.1 NADH dehydrogenase subunit 3 [Deroceras laeve]